MTGSATATDDIYLGGQPRSVLYVISGPGGTGKSTLIRRLRQDDPGLGYVRNYTTRAPRPFDERSGIRDEDWFSFVDTKEFQSLVREDRLVQWSHATKGYLSGTPLAPIEEAIASGEDLIFDYTPQLYMNLRQNFRALTVGIFIVPPTLGHLRRRLESRGGEDVAAMKFEMGRQDLAFIQEHDYVVVNDDLEVTLAQLKAIRVAEKLRRTNQLGIDETYRRLAPRPMLFYYDPFGERVRDIHDPAKDQ